MKSYKYLRVAEHKAAVYLKLCSLDDFIRFIDYQQYKQVLLLPATEQSKEHFAVVHEGTVMMKETEDFQTLEDYQAAEKAAFPDAKTYYEGLAVGCASYKDYEDAMQSGTQDLKTINKLRKAGFIEGFPAFTLMKQNNAQAASIKAGTAFELYEWASAANFASFVEMQDALERGFTEANIYKVALEKKYKNAEDFQKGTEGRYLNAEEWKEAQKIKARDREDYARYYELELLDLPQLKHDEKCVIVLLSKLPQHKKVSVNKFKDLLKQQIESCRHTDTNEMPSWFTTAFTEDYTLTDFLQKHDEVKVYGNYDKDGEYFETKPLQDRIIVVDGSNAAFPFEKKVGEKPRLSNIMRVVKALKERGFTEIIVMSDASLIHRIADGENLAALKEMATYIQTPAEKPADIFMIDYVKIHRCLLLSNDTFREWKMNDAWIAENIDYYRLSFVVNNETVLLPDLEMEKVK